MKRILYIVFFPYILAVKFNIWLFPKIGKWLKFRWGFYYTLLRKYLSLEGALVLGIAAVVFEIKGFLFIAALVLDIS